MSLAGEGHGLVSLETHYEVQAFLFREARLLDEECFEEWLALRHIMLDQHVILDENMSVFL